MVQISCGEEGEETVVTFRCCSCCLCNLRLAEARPARKETCKFAFCRLESGRERIVDSGLFYVLFPLYTRLSKTELN